jgi:hypothetical protein
MRQSGSTGKFRAKEKVRDESSPTVETRSALDIAGLSREKNSDTWILKMLLWSMMPSPEDSIVEIWKPDFSIPL